MHRSGFYRGGAIGMSAIAGIGKHGVHYNERYSQKKFVKILTMVFTRSSALGYQGQVLQCPRS